MIYPRFAYIPQPVFADQRDAERVFVIARRHIVDFIQSLLILFSLILLPIIIAAIFGSSIVTFVGANDPYWADLIFLSAMVYFLMLTMVFMTSWVGFYYNLLIITDERIVEITQKGFFSRETFEMTYDQVEDVNFSSKGFLATYFDVGEIEIQTAGSQRNFIIKKAPRPQMIWAVIHDITMQAKSHVATKDRFPSGEIIGMIINTPVLKTAKIPPIMNFRGGLDKARKKFVNQTKEPKSLRQRFDRWWWRQLKRDQVLFLDYQSGEFKETVITTEGEKSNEEMIDL